MANKFTVSSLTDAILRGFQTEGFQDVGYLEKFARGIARGIHEEIMDNTVSITIGETTFNVFDPTIEI